MAFRSTTSYGSGQSGHARHSERQPALFGAAPFQYRAGTDVADINKPPAWEPEMAYNREYQYNLEEWIRDLRRWLAATKLAPQRQGPLVSLAVGGAARIVLDDVDETMLVDGALADFGDGRGMVQRSGVECILRLLRLKFPANVEANMLKAGLEFFAFCPRPGELYEIIILRFDTMLTKADQTAELQISFPFKSWMLLSLLRLPSRKWTELLKDMNHHFPRNQEQYKELQRMILRERALESQVLSLAQGSNSSHHFVDGGSYLMSGVGEPVPLYICLPSPCIDSDANFTAHSAYLNSSPSGRSDSGRQGGGEEGEDDGTMCVYNLRDFPAFDDSDTESDEDQWDDETVMDPW